MRKLDDLQLISATNINDIKQISLLTSVYISTSSSFVIYLDEISTLNFPLPKNNCIEGAKKTVSNSTVEKRRKYIRMQPKYVWYNIYF